LKRTTLATGYAIGRSAHFNAATRYFLFSPLGCTVDPAFLSP
jgi:hypothetical protein